MAAFYVYVDDSGKYENITNKYTALCGYLAGAEEWQRFAKEWTYCRMRWQVPPIHMSPIMFPDRRPEWQDVRNKWGPQWEERRDAMVGEFSRIIRNSHLVYAGAVVDAEHFRSLQESDFKRESKDPLYLAFHRVVMQGLEKTEIIDACSPIGIIIDDDRASSLRCYELLHLLKQAFPKVRNRVHSLCYADDKSYPGLQAADMIAYESRGFMEERRKNPSAESSELYASLTFFKTHQPKLYTAALLDELNLLKYDGSTSGDAKES